MINENNKFYIGSTKNLVRRFNLHNSGKVLSTKGYKWRIVYYEAYLDDHDARVREQKLKHHANGIIQLKMRLKGSILSVNKNSEG